MQELGLNEIRERFLRFFEDKGHLRLPGFPLIPQDDPSILLINAGMTPLKPFFTGQKKPPALRIATCQKCIRTPDIEKVGKTARHGTFFEMLGNFSFDDYFKKDAIVWAWEFITENLKIDRDRLWVSIYKDDDEAYDIWNRVIGLEPGRIVRMGKENNFWEHGTGPCGPCSEIYYDRGVDKGCGRPECSVGCECDRFIELWNLVFTQFNREEDGSYTKLEKNNIDTGMGLERLASIMQGADSLFEIDTVKRILDHVCKTADVPYEVGTGKRDVSIRVITDHIRSTVMMVSDGIIPSNEGRGYVLRRLLRRAARHGRLLGIREPFLYDTAGIVILESQQAYPELREKEGYIKKIIRLEEERFEDTIDQGIGILDVFMDFIADDKDNEFPDKLRNIPHMDNMSSEGYIRNIKENRIIPGAFAFVLHDTYGFPFDITKEIAEENGLKVDEKEFEMYMEQQRQRARKALKDREGSAWGQDKENRFELEAEVEFTGYDEFTTEAEIINMIKDNTAVGSLNKGEKAVFILDRTPFYAESGGQVGDKGIIESDSGSIVVEDCKKNASGSHIHSGYVKSGNVKVGQKVRACIDKRKRIAASRNHTATHLLQKSLKNVLGEHVRQAGSFVSDERLRFDFTHFASLSVDEIKRVEKEVNKKILDNLSVNTKEMDLDEAKKTGATALFGEKYGKTVRVVSIGDYSLELCGGTHIKTTSEAGMFKITGESGVASGVRRIEALTGEAALMYYDENEKILGEITGILKTTRSESVKRIKILLEELKHSQKQIESMMNKLIHERLDDMLSQKKEIEGVRVLSVRIDGLDPAVLRDTAGKLKDRLGSGIVVLGSGNGDKVSFVAMATVDTVNKGVHAGNILKEAANITGGGGGGRPDMAQAGGKDAAMLDRALESVYEGVRKQLCGGAN